MMCQSRFGAKGTPARAVPKSAIRKAYNNAPANLEGNFIDNPIYPDKRNQIKRRRSPRKK